MSRPRINSANAACVYVGEPDRPAANCERRRVVNVDSLHDPAGAFANPDQLTRAVQRGLRAISLAGEDPDDPSALVTWIGVPLRTRAPESAPVVASVGGAL